MKPSSESPFKSAGGFHRLSGALRYSWQGLCAAWQHEAAFRQELLLLALLAPLALWLSASPAELLLLLGSFVFVLIVELMNSALEAVADAVTLERHPLIGRAKDLASAAVFLSLALASCIWLVTLGPRLWALVF